jgi:hypothetical protein
MFETTASLVNALLTLLDIVRIPSVTARRGCVCYCCALVTRASIHYRAHTGSLNMCIVAEYAHKYTHGVPPPPRAPNRLNGSTVKFRHLHLRGRPQVLPRGHDTQCRVGGGF